MAQNNNSLKMNQNAFLKKNCDYTKKPIRSFPACLGFVKVLMTTRATSPSVTCLTLKNCGVSPQKKPKNNMCERERYDDFKNVFG